MTCSRSMVFQWFAADSWFSSDFQQVHGFPLAHSSSCFLFSSANKTNSLYITNILFKVALNTALPNPIILLYDVKVWTIFIEPHLTLTTDNSVMSHDEEMIDISSLLLKRK
jgi:hypothetical protein